MIYILVNHYWEWLQVHNLRFLRVFLFPSFQATISVLLSFFLCIIFGPRIIGWLRRQKIGDLPEFDQAEINKLMEGKKGTPTMGGILIIASIAITTLLMADLRNFYVQMALLCLLWLGAVGATDDWLKLTAGRRQGSRQGLTTLEKLLFQVGLGVVLCYFTFQYHQHIPAANRFYFPFLKNVYVPLGMTGFVIIGTLVMTGSSNAVNLTDGLDGLASGCTAIVSFAFLVLALIVGTDDLANTLLLTYIQASDQMAVLAGAMTGASLGFLWYNCNPAKVFMGDTGSLALGGLLGYIAIVTRQELMLFMVGGIFVLEALSVILQVSYFKYTRRRFGEGRRIFLMSPLHHHFQRKGWTENQVVVRFWLLTAMLAAMALATVKLR
ncbi:MAG: phospho-N-acetylmuramoyl-pentapeptide-transferase [Phycisphaerales bacterium]|nr:phospho-N-acetylmuramoyl-pentapeptide-transferase [Phycisphaerales bacterium]